jgi:hypothetical protein
LSKSPRRKRELKRRKSAGHTSKRKKKTVLCVVESFCFPKQKKD